MILFHGTSSRFLPQIRKHGLRPRGALKHSVYRALGDEHLESHGEYIYLTDTYPLGFAYNAIRAFGGNIAVARVVVDVKDLLPDTDFSQTTDTGAECLEAHGTACLKAGSLMPNKLYVIDFKKHKDVLNFDINAGLGHLAYKQSMQRHTEDVLFYLCHKTFEYDEGLKEWGDGW